MTVCRYLDITSATRDRTQFPNPFEFDVVYTNLSPQTEPSKIADSVSKTVGYKPDVFDRDNGEPLNTATSQVLAVSAQSVAGAYVGQHFYVFDGTNALVLSTVVTAYNATNNVITVEDALPALAPSPNLYYYFFRDTPLSSANTFTLDIANCTRTSLAIAQAIPNAQTFVGKWVQVAEFVPDELVAEPKRIERVTTTLSSTTLFLAPSANEVGDTPTYLSAVPSGAGIQVYINDVVNNWQPLVYNGTTVGVQVPRCYNLDLCDMIISNSQIVYSHPGGAISTYPYIYLEINAESQSTKNILVSNNQYSKNAVFKIPTSSDMITSFINLRSCTSQTIKFKPNDTFRFRFLRPDGEVLKWSNNDTLPPFLPDPTLQISFTIRFCPVNCVEDV